MTQKIRTRPKSGQSPRAAAKKRTQQRKNARRAKLAAR